MCVCVCVHYAFSQDAFSTSSLLLLKQAERKIDVTGCTLCDGLFDLAASLQVSLIITCAGVFVVKNMMIYWLGSCQIEPLSLEVFMPKARAFRSG